MMARANLGQLLGNLGESAAATPHEAELSDPGEGARPRAAGAAATRTQDASPSVNAPIVPAYLRFVRKETRLREDQQNQLTIQARRLNRAKTSQGSRITENSLIRIAVDLLLANIEGASGDDEDAIRTSLGA